MNAVSTAEVRGMDYQAIVSLDALQLLHTRYAVITTYALLVNYYIRVTSNF